MIIFVYGADTVRAQAHVQKLQERFREQRDPDGFNTLAFDVKEQEVSFLKEQLLAVPFLAEKRMVVFKNFFEADVELHAWVLQRYDDLMGREDGVFVFVTEQDAVKKNELFKKLSEEKFAAAFPVPSGDKLEQWIARQVQERGGSIDRTAVSTLARTLSDDMAQLGNRIHQLVAYAAGRGNREMITQAMVHVFVPQKNEDMMFALMDAITRKNTNQALGLLEQQAVYGSEPQQIFGMLVRQYRILMDLYSYTAAHLAASEQEIAQALGVHPFVVKKTMPMVKQYSFDQLARGQEQLLLIDQKIKRGAADMPELLTLFIGNAAA